MSPDDNFSVPLGLLCLAAYLRRELPRVSIRVVDCNVERSRRNNKRHLPNNLPSGDRLRKTADPTTSATNNPDRAGRPR